MKSNVILLLYLLWCFNFRPQRVNWLKVDDDVPSHAVITGADLYIENLNKSYNGTYRCVASNSIGEAYDDYTLYVYGTFIYHWSTNILLSLTEQTSRSFPLLSEAFFLQKTSSNKVWIVASLYSLWAILTFKDLQTFGLFEEVLGEWT